MFESRKIGVFPALGFTITRRPPVIGDVPADFQKKHEFDKSRDKSAPVSTSVVIGILGFKISLPHRRKK